MSTSFENGPRTRDNYPKNWWGWCLAYVTWGNVWSWTWEWLTEVKLRIQNGLTQCQKSWKSVLSFIALRRIALTSVYCCIYIYCNCVELNVLELPRKIENSQCCSSLNNILLHADYPLKNWIKKLINYFSFTIYKLLRNYEPCNYEALFNRYLKFRFIEKSK